MHPFFFYEFVFLALAINAGKCLSCYQCNNKSKACNDHFKKRDFVVKQCAADLTSVDLILNTTATETMTTKTGKYVCVKVIILENNIPWVTRACAKEASTENFCKKLLDQSKSMTGKPPVILCETCEENGCNGVGNVKPLFLSIFMACGVFVFPQLV